MTIMKPTLIFLPGFSFDANLWQSLAEQLSYPYLLLNLPEPKACDSLDSLTDQLSVSIPPQSIIIAWSLGGLFALKLAKKYPQHCQKLILVASTPKFTATADWPGIPESTIEAFYLLAQKNLSNLLKKFTQLVAYPHHQKTQSALWKYLITEKPDENFHCFYLNLLKTVDLRDIYQNLRLPILHINGNKDAILPIFNLQRALKIIPYAGHAPFITHLSELRVLINEFINTKTSH